MKKILALLLAMVMCVYMVACSSGDTNSEDTVESKTENTVNMDEESQQEETEESTEYQYLTAEQVEDCYQAIMNGDVQSEGIDVIRSLDEETMRLAIDAVAMILGEEDVLGHLEDFDAKTMDQIMTEVMFIINQASKEETEDPYGSESEEEFIEDMGTTMVLYDAELDRSLVIDFDPVHAFLEPDWAMMKDQPVNYFINIDNNYETYTLTYGAMNVSTEDLIKVWIANDAKEGKETSVTDIKTFTVGGVEWELFALYYERTSTGIDKETGKEVTSTYISYEPICFARPDSETALQIEAGNSSNPDVLEHYKELIQTSITKITIE